MVWRIHTDSQEDDDIKMNKNFLKLISRKLEVFYF
jgi:hypothetical protein